MRPSTVYFDIHLSLLVDLRALMYITIFPLNQCLQNADILLHILMPTAFCLDIHSSLFSLWSDKTCACYALCTLQVCVPL
eukprot:c34009_g1_i1 orf=75-314(+)